MGWGRPTWGIAQSCKTSLMKGGSRTRVADYNGGHTDEKAREIQTLQPKKTGGPGGENEIPKKLGRKGARRKEHSSSQGKEVKTSGRMIRQPIGEELIPT